MSSPLILIVDEDESLFDLLKTHFSQKYRILHDSDYENAIKTAKEEKPSYILAGIEIDNLSWIPKIKESSDALLVAMSKNDEDIFVVSLLKLGVFAYNHKPIFMDGLFSYLRDGLELKKFNWNIISAFERWVEVEMPSESAYINAYCSFIQYLMPEFKYKQMMMYAIKELVQNAIEHGNKYDEDKKVNICFQKMDKQILFTIKDDGPGFSMDLLPHAVVGPQKKNPLDVLEYRKSLGMRPGGLGIHSVSRIADEIIYNEKGNAVTMVKNIPKD